MTKVEEALARAILSSNSEGTDAAKEILKSGISPKLRLGGVPMVTLAAHVGSINALVLLSDYGADLNARPDPNSEFFLHYEGMLDPLKFAFEEDETVIGLCALNGMSCEELTLLLGRGINPNILSNDGVPPIYWPMAYGSEESLKAFCRYNADINMRDNEGLTSVLLLVENGLWMPYGFRRHNFDYLNHLRTFGADLTLTDNLGRNIYEIATPYPDLAEWILAHTEE
ncbi:ankyrin repeat domain-containing protein [Alteromonas pelagimontana]|uniref:Ankyrin repeat domain-containing protein n=1 Tax=Alteromonas pelagimontana TaxID=1858656 RepID=A0A6M4MDY5_9ALTE|nr:ankyrin repeat domain-containing protein [Alteromonas pelagimontana]QJR81048.1 ankyrin repeat domain-containing protein [Alteromonas pelagimontana]